MLRLKRLAVFCVFTIAVVTGLLFWVLHPSGAAALWGQSPPPQSGAKLSMLASISTPAVDITEDPVDGPVAGAVCGADRDTCQGAPGLRGSSRTGQRRSADVPDRLEYRGGNRLRRVRPRKPRRRKPDCRRAG